MSPERAGIHALLSRQFTGAAVDSAAIRVDGPTRIGRYSRIYRAQVPGLPTPLAVKCLLDPATGGPDHSSARDQFDVLDRVHRAMATTDRAFRVPMPYLLDEGGGIVAAEWVDGRPMTDLFLSRDLTLAQGTDLFRRAAAWIRRFFALRPLPPAPLDIGRMLDDISAIARTPVGTYSSARAAFAALRKHAEVVGTYPVERSWLHGDFKSDNLLVDDGALVGIDVHARHENAVLHDVASFVDHWELTLCDPRAWRWRPHRAALIGAFLDAFDPALRTDRRLPFQWVALYGMLGIWEEFTRRRQRTLRHVYLAACFRQQVRRMMRELAEAARGLPR
jgi:hypothetical protein